jgi:hypothetical protein
MNVDSLLFACAGLALPRTGLALPASNSSLETGVGTMAAAAALPPPSALDPNFAQAFNLSSRPSATKKIWYACVMWCLEAAPPRPGDSLCMQSMLLVRSAASAELQTWESDE